MATHRQSRRLFSTDEELDMLDDNREEDSDDDFEGYVDDEGGEETEVVGLSEGAGQQHEAVNFEAFLDQSPADEHLREPGQVDEERAEFEDNSEYEQNPVDEHPEERLSQIDDHSAQQANEADDVEEETETDEVENGKQPAH